MCAWSVGTTSIRTTIYDPYQPRYIIRDKLLLTTFRHVNGPARWIVNSILQYRKIFTHAPGLIRGCLSVGTGSSYSCRELYETLCTAECESCGDFGGYTYTIACRRVCCLCFTEGKDYVPPLREDAMRKFALSSNGLKALPSMKCAPGRYSPRNIKCRARYVDPSDKSSSMP